MTTAPKVPSICDSSCRPNLTNSQIYGMILRTIPFWVQKIIQIPQPPHMMYCVGTRIQHHHTKHTQHPGRWNLSIMMTHAAIQKQVMMDNHLQTSCVTAAIKWDTIPETACPTHLLQAWGHNNCRWDSPWCKKHASEWHQKYKLSPIGYILQHNLHQELRPCYIHLWIWHRQIIKGVYKQGAPGLQLHLHHENAYFQRFLHK